MNKYQHTLEKLENNTAKRSIALVIEGALIGVLAGLTAVLYRYCLTYAESGLYAVLNFIRGNAGVTALWFAALILMGCIVAKIVKWEPMAAGSGIPQVSGEVRGYLDQSFWRVVLAKFTGGTLSIFGGLSLGREGPSIQLGAMVAKSYSRLRNYDKTTEIGLLSCGAGAGLAAAFNAPLAGIMFVLEEIHHTFDRTMLVAGLIATVCADFVAKIFFGQSAIFDNGKEYYANRNEDVRIIAYHYGNLMMRDSCHYCKFKKIPRVGADITLADFWRINPDDVDDIDSGVSLVMINTDKGNKWVDKIKDTTVFVEKDIEQALKGNSAIYKSAKRGKNRDKFLSELDCLPFDELVEKYKDKKSGVLKRAINKARNIAKMLISGARNA